MPDVRVAVLFPGALGDLCLVAPALRALVARGTIIELSVQRALAPLVPLLHPGFAAGPAIDGAVMASLFAGDPAPELAGWLTTADRVHAWLARGDRDGELTARLAALGVPFALHAVARDDTGPHASEEYAAALGVTEPVDAFAVSPSSPLPELHPWHASMARRLVLHPGAGGRAKAWDADGFRCVADEWRAGGGEVVVLLGPAERADVAAWRTVGHATITDASILAAAAVIGSAPLWVGNDSGMSHLAGALGRRGVVVFRATRPERWRPRGGRLAVVACRNRPNDVVAHEVMALLRSYPPDQLDTPRDRH